jgi:peptide/histidine transporter 3/4
MISLIFVTISIFIFTCIGLLLSLLYKFESLDYFLYPKVIFIAGYCLFFIVLVTFMIGLVGYQANFIQLGLDQLLEASSEYLGLFVHWAEWINNAVAVVTIMVLSLVFTCNVFDQSHGIKLHFEAIFIFLFTGFGILCFFLMVTSLILSFYKSHWFYSEPGQRNPYRTVFKILNYVRTHKYPLQRSAFTYGDNIIPSRFDFAKERFGGPFTTEQVEDVKTLFRILSILLVLGPIHLLQIPASLIVFPLFGIHTGHDKDSYVHPEHDQCNWDLLFLRSNIMVWLISTLLFPLYIWLIFSRLRKRMPRILIRLSIGILILFLGVVSMVVIDAVGHSMHLTTASLNTTAIHDRCMLHARSYRGYLHYPTLNMHWSVLIPPNILLGLGPPLVEATTLEFISAQSPQSMKGFLVGIYFAIKGLFQFLGSVTIIPVSLNHPLGIDSFDKLPSFVSCGFIYLSFTCAVGLIGVVLFFVAARKYKYRVRDEVTFRQRDVEEVYDRYLTQVATAAQSTGYDSSDD